MATESEKPQKTKKPKNWKHKGVPMCLKTDIESHVQGNDKSKQSIRAMYITTRTCLQTFCGPFTKYMNIPLRLFEGHIPLSHWTVLFSTELPPDGTRSGQKWKLTESCTFTGSTYELDVPTLGENQANIHMDSCENRFPAATRRSRDVVYLGTTTMSDAELEEVGKLVLEYLQIAEKGYHYLHRNCQHFVVFLASVVCPEAKIPKTADTLWGGLFSLLKRKNKDITKRITAAKEFYEVRRTNLRP